MLDEAYSIPFDYACFHHQPTHEEIAALDALLCQVAVARGPPCYREEVERVVRALALTHKSTTIEMQKAWDGMVHRWPVHSGLMSGLRGTSYVGTTFNKVMAALATQLTRRWTGVLPRTDCYLRGDDSTTIHARYLV